MEYNFKEVEKKWQSYWKENQTYKVDVDPSKPKFYVLDMFPYPSGASKQDNIRPLQQRKILPAIGNNSIKSVFLSTGTGK